MTATLKTWHGGVSVGASRACDECGAPADTLFELGIHARGASGRWACRACVLDPARQIGVIDRRGDSLHGARAARELDATAAIATHLEIASRANTPAGIDYGPPLVPLPLPAAYVHVLAALDRCARVDEEFATAITELRATYERATCFSPKQMLLVQWRLSKNGITHEPSNFAVSIRSDKEVTQVRGLGDWQKRKLAPFLSWAQRGRFGF